MDKQAVYAYLTAQGIPYEITEHPAVFNMAEVAQIPLPHPEADAKNLFVRDDKRAHYYLITVKGDKRVDLKAFRRRHATRPLTFASAEELMHILGLIPGAVTPLGVLNGDDAAVEVFLDRDFFDAPGLIGVHPNDNTATVWLRAADLAALIEAHGNSVTIEDMGDSAP